MTEANQNTDTDGPTYEQLAKRVEDLEGEVEDLRSGQEVEDEQGRTWSLGALLNLGLTRREALVVLGALGSGVPFAIAFRRAIGMASANPDEVDAGTPSKPVDVYASNVFGPHGDIDFQDPVSIGSASIEDALNLTPVSQTITSGEITYNSPAIRPAPESGSSDTLTTINDGSDGDTVVLNGIGGNSITVEDGTGNIQLESDTNKKLDSGYSVLLLYYMGSNWVELAFGNN